MSTKTRWGIIATGWVSDKFTRALKLLMEAEPMAGGSPSIVRTMDALREEWGVKYPFE
jgi:hypothetical protein